jgi:aspartyl-tRNA(Asn)/glutamyl-tRNA(Gln) amidotransferase subunit B
MTAVVDYDDAVNRYEPVLGLEVHVELSTNTKMFCGCPVAFGGEPNTQTCPVCLGLPGALPVVNAAAVESAIRIGLALNCSIAETCRFARKNYFYPDMPKDYQISQYDEPLCFNGWLDVHVPGVDGEPPTTVTVGIERVHMEEDTGKLTHAGGATGRIHGADYSLVDYNRAGVPLIEIVTKPIVGTGANAPEVAKAYVTQLRDLLRALGVSDVRMEEGSLRCDANVSIAPAGAEWGTRTETKNVNSLRSVERAVRFEITRQAAVLDGGGTITQETRHFHEDDGTTTPGRSKETAEDYRYFQDPDLVPLAPSPQWVDELRQTMPEPPNERRERLREDWGLSEFDMASVINAGALDLVVDTIEAGADHAGARKWWLGELAREANDRGVALADLPVTPAQVAEVDVMVSQGRLNDKLAREVFAGLLAQEGTPEEIVAARGLEVVSDESVLVAAVDEVIAANPDVAEKIRDGKVAAAGALIGQVMKATGGKADAARVRELILTKLG